MATALDQSENYRVLRRLIPRTLSKPPAEESKIGILLDFETTLCDIDADCRDFHDPLLPIRCIFEKLGTRCEGRPRHQLWNILNPETSIGIVCLIAK
jgi:hypothetical protein